MPFKNTQVAKSRLHPPRPLSRPELARAIARDTLETVSASLVPGDVIVVTSDPDLHRVASDLGCTHVPDPGGGLNAAIGAGLETADLAHGAARAVLLGDLPALDDLSLHAALALCARHESAVVADQAGTGTVLLTAAPGRPLVPRFGPGSAARHAETATLLTPDLPRLRRDVDNLEDLMAAVQLGVGPHTARVLAEAATDAGLRGTG